MSTGDGNESSLIRKLAGLQDASATPGFLDIAFDTVAILDAQERIIFWNPAAEQVFGWTAQEVLGREANELFWPARTPQEQEDRKRRKSRVDQGETLRGKLTSCRKDGSTLPIQYTARALLDAEGRVKGYLVICHDISAEVLARENEEKLTRSNQRLNEILSSIQDDFYVLNRDWVFVFASRTFTSRVGKEPEDFVGNNIWEMFPMHVGGILYENFHAAMEKRQTRRFEIPGKYTDAWYRMTAFPSADGITVLGTDITENKRAEQAIMESRRKYQDLIETTSDFIWEMDTQGRYTYCSPQMEELWGLRPEEMIGKTPFDVMPPEEAQTGQEYFREMAGSAAPFRGLTTTAFNSQGQLIYIETSGVPFFDPNGTLLGFRGVTRDITKRKRGEEERQKAERRYHIVGEVIPFGVWETDVEGNATYLSPVFLELTGQTLEEHRQSWQSLIHAEETDSLVTAWRECVRNGTPWDREFRILGKDGIFHAIHARGLPLYNSTGEITSYVGINFDITERKQTEDALRESERQLLLLNESLEQKVQEKTEEVRRLASDTTKAVQRERHRISHILHDDLQQRIYALQMQLTFLHYELHKESETARNELADIESQLAELLEITRHISIDLSPPILRDEGLAHAIHWLAGQMLQRYGLSIEVQADGAFAIPDEELHVFLFNCVRELLFNVVKHSGAGQAWVALQWLDSGLQIQVRDDGKGFPVGTVDEPLSIELSIDMAREDDLRSSFGLPTIHQQLSLFGGRMEIRSRPGAGTQITLFVPVSESG